ncbi:ESPR-type extended signal peptide-containing protein [Acinetobacter vivianii]
MNKIYRLVWNKSLSLWTVVSENARGVTKKRNVTTIQTVAALSPSSLQHNNKLLNLKPNLIALTISSIFLSTGTFAAVNTGGGGVSNNGSGNSMAISPTGQQCGNVGQATVNGNSGVAVGCGNNISGTDETFAQSLNNRRGGNVSNNYPTGATSITGASTAIGKSNRITGVGGATVVGNANISDGGNFHNVAIGQGNRTGGAGYNTALGIGNDASAGNSNVVIGVDNRARSNTAIAIGRGTWADADFAIAQGNTATVAAGATGGIAMGNAATTKGVRGIAIGSGTGGASYDATAANAEGADSIAIGTESKAKGDQDIAIGKGAYAQGVTENGRIYTATAMGEGARAEGKNTTAIGQQSKATAFGASAFGALSEATAQYASALGDGSKATADFTTAIGNQANASAVGATVAGSNSIASGQLSTGYGALVKATGEKSTALGTGAQSEGDSSVAIGENSNAQGENDIAIGRDAATSSGTTDNIAIGHGVTTGDTGQNVAMGSGATSANAASSEGGAVAIGRDQVARGDGAVAIGDPNNANGNGAVALGRNNTAAGNDDATEAANGAIAIGNENKAIGQGSVALGNASTAAEAGAIALGDSANAQAARGIALGSNAVATNADDVALGAGSITSTATGDSFLTGIAAPASVVSVGSAGNERRIQHLSDGAEDTDAVNVRQLKHVKGVVDEQGESTANALGGGSTYDPEAGAVSNPTYNINGNDMNNVGDALAELDKGWTLQTNGENAGAVKAGDTVDIGTADGEENLQVEKEGNNIKYSLNRDLKVDSVTAGDTVLNTDGMTIAGGPSVTKSGIDAAGNKITNVAEGTEGTDAVNKDQLDSATTAAN